MQQFRYHEDGIVICAFKSRQASTDGGAVARDRKEYMRRYQLAWLKKRRDAWIKENGPCRSCGSNDELEIDHVDPLKKEFKINFSSKKTTEELKKCQVLCNQCHKNKTIKEMTTRVKGKNIERLHPIEWKKDVLGAIKNGMSHREASAFYGVSRKTIWRWKQKEATWLFFI